MERWIHIMVSVYEEVRRRSSSERLQPSVKHGGGCVMVSGQSVLLEILN